jgi:hypothetical protein
MPPAMLWAVILGIYALKLWVGPTEEPIAGEQGDGLGHSETEAGARVIGEHPIVSIIKIVAV